MEIDHFGLKRNADHLSASIDDVLPDLGLTLSSLTGASEDSWSVLFPLNGVASPYTNDFSFGPYAQAQTNWPFEEQQRNTDFSQEFRVTSDQDRRFRYLVGASYLRTRLEYANSQLYYFGSEGLPTFANTIDPIYDSSTFGLFYGLDFDITPELTLDVEGRYQSERLTARDFNTSDVLYEVVYKDFVPRVSLEYKFMKNALAYFTWSKGVDPGQAVDPLASIPAQDQAQAIAEGAKTGVKPEFLYNYELGLKGRFLDDRLIFSGDVYYDIWLDKIVAQDILIVNPGAPPTYQSIFTNLGKVELPGVELEVTAKPVDSYVVNVSGAVAASSVKQGVCDACGLLTGSTSIQGNQLPNYSKYSGQASGEYTSNFPLLPGFKWYQRSEITYKSGQYEGEGDYAKSPSQTYVNFRLGLRSANINVEGFVTNAFNNKAYTSVLNDWNLSNPGETYGAYDSVYVGLPFLRTYGARVRYDF
jgi:iron complex outermembrane receptor protein